MFRFADEALTEFLAASRYYERQVPGLGESLVDEIEAGVRDIVASPMRWRIVDGDIRRYLVRRFPYGIYYSVEGDILVIWAVKHLHRHPDYWQQRRS